MSTAQITKMRLPDGSEVAFVDWGDLPIYSTAYLLSGFSDTEIDFFTYIAGDTIECTENATPFTSTERDTNVQVAASMAATEEMLVYAIRPEIFELTTSEETPEDIAAAAPTVLGQPMPSATNLGILQLSLMLKLRISEKDYADAGFGYFNSGMGPSVAVYAPAAITSTRSWATQGVPGQDAVRSLAMPAYMGGQEKFRLFLANYTGAAVTFRDEEDPTSEVDNVVMRIRMYLDGLYKRPVS